MKKTKIMGAALSAVVVGLLAVGCDSALLDNAANTDRVTPGVTEEDVNVQMFDPGKEISLWYGEVLNEAKDYKASAIMKMEPLPKGESEVIDGYIEFAIIKDYKTGGVTKNTGWLGTYKITGVSANTLQMDLDWGGDKGYPGMNMFGLTLKPAEKAAVVSGRETAKTDEFQFTMRPAAVGSKTLNAEELTKGFARATGADDKNFVLSLDTQGNFQIFGKINDFALPNEGRGKYVIDNNGEITLTVNYNGQDVVINRVAGKTISDEGHGSVAVEKCLWIAFDSTDLKKVGYPEDTSKFFSNLPILFSLASNPVTK